MNSGYTAVQQKALEVLDGVWISDEVRMNIEIGGQVLAMLAVPSDTIVFLSKFQAPQTFYAYDYLQGKDVKNFIACGTCEYRTGSSLVGIEQDCYFYVIFVYSSFAVFCIKRYGAFMNFEGMERISKAIAKF